MQRIRVRSILRDGWRSFGEWPVYPILLSILPVLTIYARNASFLTVGHIWVPVIIGTALALACLALVYLIVRDIHRAGLVTALMMIWFTTYGHWTDLLGDLGLELPFGIVVGPNKWMFLAGGLLFLASIYLSARWVDHLPRATRALNLAFGLLIAFNAVRIGVHEMEAGGRERDGETAGISGDGSDRCGDIYYLVLDAYGRADILRSHYGIDPEPFLGRLRRRGFYVATESRANYVQTVLSLAATLNMRYLDELALDLGVGSDDRRPLSRMMQESELVQFLRSRGYRLVTFDAMPWESAAVEGEVHFESPIRTFNLLEIDLIHLTPIPAVLDLSENTLAESHRQSIRHAFDNLRRTPQLVGRKFVYFHVLAPHQPFVFDAEGDARDPGSFDAVFTPVETEEERIEYVGRYRDQLSYITTLVERALEEILTESARPPVVVLQADHGPASRLDPESHARTDLDERLGILNALYLPGYDGGSFRPDLSPVNTFRIVLNHCFDSDLPLLPDRSFFSTWSRPLDFIPVDRRSTSAAAGKRGNGE